MNADLKSLLLNLPKPLLLVNNETKEAVLANIEVTKLLSVTELDETKRLININKRLKDKIFKPYNYVEGLGDKEE